MKIGIITFWETQDNYGQVLQAYALQTYLKELGHDSYIIRYDHDNQAKYRKYKVLRKIVKVLLVYPIIKAIREKMTNNIELIKYNQEKNKLREIDNFRNKYFKFSSKIYHTLKEIQEQPPLADIYIAGSDQIWGKSWLLNNKENQVFFLNFGNITTRRIAYAPSFGMKQYPARLIKELGIQLKRFNALSVREKDGSKICEAAGYHVEYVCDPTLLLRGVDYEKLFKKEECRKDIFIYCLNISDSSEIGWESIIEMANKVSLKIKVTIASGYIPAKEIFGDVNYHYATVDEWLSNIANSELIITTSFHGVVFSLLFHKNFVFVPLKGKHSCGNNRVYDLLNLAGVNGHVWNTIDNIEYILKSEIDWTIVDININAFRKQSMNFILSNIN